MKGNLRPPCLYMRHTSGRPSTTPLTCGKRMHPRVQTCLFGFMGFYDPLDLVVVEVEVDESVGMVVIPRQYRAYVRQDTPLTDSLRNPVDEATRIAKRSKRKQDPFSTASRRAAILGGEP